VKLKRTILSISVLPFLIATACQSANQSDNAADNIVVVNSPATGWVKRIVVAEGVHVDRGAPVVEIAVQSEPGVAATPARAGAEARAIGNYQAADAEIESARAEVVRHEAEVGRLTPLVSSGEVSQGQLDGERALYEQAQRRLTQAQEAKRNAVGALLAARQPNQNPAINASTPREQIVSAVASSPGKVTVINTRVGEPVRVGQPLATIRADN
jgi:multidrug resistance efflux pump